MADLVKAFPSVDVSLVQSLLGELETAYGNLENLGQEAVKRAEELAAAEGPEILKVVETDTARLLQETINILDSLKTFVSTNPQAAAIAADIEKAVAALEALIGKVQG